MRKIYVPARKAIRSNINDIDLKRLYDDLIIFGDELSFHPNDFSDSDIELAKRVIRYCGKISKEFNDIYDWIGSDLSSSSDRTYTIRIYRKGRESEVTDTLPGLIKYFGYTLEKGKSWEHEKGNKKINTNPRNINELVKNLNNAENNAAANGYSGIEYYL